MKIQCDVCEKEEAMVFCPADEAALCQACDHRVHLANKLATKHNRFNLQRPSKDCPICDICQERRGLVFCQEDRAILCRECDGAIHEANECTKKHNRFLMTGLKLSPKTCTNTTSQAQAQAQASPPSSRSSSVHNLTSETSNPIKCINTPTTTPTTTNDYDLFGTNSSNMLSEVNSHCYGANNEMVPVSSGSITEYLMETLPGWHVDDFLDASPSYGFYS